jgi:hypothetical protein
MKTRTTFLLIATSLWSSCNAATTFQADGAPFKAPVTTAPGFSARVLFSNLTTPRGITRDAEENILVVERGFGVTAFSSTTGGWERQVVISNPNFTQGIQIDGDILYVSTAADVLLYHYDAVTKSVGVPSVVVSGLPPDGGKSSSFFMTRPCLRFRFDDAYSPTPTYWGQKGIAYCRWALHKYRSNRARSSVRAFSNTSLRASAAHADRSPSMVFRPDRCVRYPKPCRFRFPSIVHRPPLRSREWCEHR